MRGGLLRRSRWRRKRARPEPAAVRGLGEPPALPEAAGDAELDELRGELVRELDRLAARRGDRRAA